MQGIQYLKLQIKGKGLGRRIKSYKSCVMNNLWKVLNSWLIFNSANTKITRDSNSLAYLQATLE